MSLVTSVYVRLCPVLFGFYDTTDVFFGTLADIEGHWRTRTDLCFKGRPAFRDRITKGNLISKGSCRLRKPKKYFRLIMIRVA